MENQRAEALADYVTQLRGLLEQKTRELDEVQLKYEAATTFLDESEKKLQVANLQNSVYRTHLKNLISALRPRLASEERHFYGGHMCVDCAGLAEAESFLLESTVTRKGLASNHERGVCNEATCYWCSAAAAIDAEDKAVEKRLCASCGGDHRPELSCQERIGK